MRRLRNSTWQGTHNVPCHGTRTVLVDFPSSSRAARRASWGKGRRSLGLYVVTTVTPSRSSRHSLLGAPQGGKSGRALGHYSVLSPQHLWANARYPAKSGSPALTSSRPSWRHVYGRRPVSPCGASLRYVAPSTQHPAPTLSLALTPSRRHEPHLVTVSFFFSALSMLHSLWFLLSPQHSVLSPRSSPRFTPAPARNRVWRGPRVRRRS